jgi:hypothetical protein
MQDLDTREHANTGLPAVRAAAPTDFFAMHGAPPTWAYHAAETSSADPTESVFRHISQVALRHDVPHEEVEEDIAQAVQSVRAANR